MKTSSHILISRRGRGAMTLLEIMVAASILLVVLAAVGALFRTTSSAVSTSQSILEMTSNVRAIEHQLSADVAGMNRSGFLLIRSRIDPVTNQRYDQLAFLATGSFHNQSGSTLAANPFNDMTSSSAAHIWWGQLVLQDDTSIADQCIELPRDAIPSSVLGRHATLLLAAPSPGATTLTYDGAPIACFPDIRYDTDNIDPGLGEPPPHISSSRLSAASITPSQIIASIRTILANNGGRAQQPTYELDQYCYRFKALPSVQSSKISIPNGYFRMTPIALQHVSSFAIEWTDSFNSSSTATWYGLGGEGRKSNDDPDFAVNEPTPWSGNQDQYVAQFSIDTPTYRWPTALRITMHIDDPAGHLQGGRTFVEILKIPE